MVLEDAYFPMENIILAGSKMGTLTAMENTCFLMEVIKKDRGSMDNMLTEMKKISILVMKQRTREV